MNTTETGIVRQRLPGVMSGRVMTALFTGGSATTIISGALITSPETAIPALLISAGGTVGSFLFGISRAKKNARKYSRSLYADEVPAEPDTKDIARAILGIKFEPKRVMVSSTPYTRTKKNFLNSTSPLSIKKVNKDVMLHQAVIETDNYVLYTPQGVFLEQVTKPTALSTWDAAYNALIDQYQIPAEKISERMSSPQARENALDAMLNGLNKEIGGLRNFMNSL